MPTYDAWYQALLHDRFDQVQPWLDHDPSLAALELPSGAFLLHIAAEKGASQCLAALLPHSDPAVVDGNGLSALGHAIQRKSAACIDLLLPVSDPTAVDEHGRTLLHLAAEKGLADTLVALLARVPAAHALSVDAEGKTALHDAAGRGDLTSVDALLPVSDPHQPDEEGWTPLMFAVLQRHQAVACRLAPVSNVTWSNEDGNSALSLAQRQGDRALHAFLETEARRQEAQALRRTAEEAAGEALNPRLRPRL